MRKMKMDEDVKDKFEGLAKQLTIVNENLNSRLDLVKWYVSGIVGIVGIVFAAASVVFTINYNTDRSAFNTQIGRGMDDLREFRQTTNEYIKEKLGTSADAKIELYGSNKVLLDDQTVTPPIFNWGNSWQVKIDFIIKNVGNATSGPLYFKIYLSAPFNTGFPSSDEPKFEYEYSVNPSDINPDVLPGNYTSSFHTSATLPSPLVRAAELKVGKYPALIRVYYGGGKVTSAPVFLAIERAVSTPDSSPSPAPPAR